MRDFVLQIHAREESQRYKVRFQAVPVGDIATGLGVLPQLRCLGMVQEGKFILEKAKILKEGNW